MEHPQPRIVGEQLQSVPFPCSLVTVSIGDLREHGLDGVVFTAPKYLFLDGMEHRAAVEQAIFEELAKADH